MLIKGSGVTVCLCETTHELTRGNIRGTAALALRGARQEARRTNASGHSITARALRPRFVAPHVSGVVTERLWPLEASETARQTDGTAVAFLANVGHIFWGHTPDGVWCGIGREAAAFRDAAATQGVP
jgi:hypothetical protein